MTSYNPLHYVILFFKIDLKNFYNIKIITNNNMTTQYIYGIVDRSGSMAGKEQDTIGGINTAIEQIKSTLKDNDRVTVFLKLFDHEQVILWNELNIKDVVPLTQTEYVPRGSTALLDAIGDTLTDLIEKRDNNQSLFESAVVYITTDGLENQSRRYNAHMISQLIKRAEDNYNIRVIYLGANQDAIMEAAKYGIHADRAMNYSEDRETVEQAFVSAANVANRTRRCGVSAFTEVERQMSSTASGNVNASSMLPPVVSRAATLPVPPAITRSPPVINHREIGEDEQHVFLDYAKRKQFDMVKQLVLSNKNYVNCVTSANRWTALHQAAYVGDIYTVQFLLNNGADKTIVNRDGFTAYDLANNNACKIILSQ